MNRVSAMSEGEGNQAGSLTRFDPFGNNRPNSTPTDITDHSLQTTFTGHKHNDDIGLIYMNARYYLPSVGRFISADTIIPDPANPQTYNRFSYVLNNPMNLVDPSGHFSEAAIIEYLYNEYGSENWYSIYEMWKADNEWWDMLLAASAGDVIFGSVIYNEIALGVYYHFTGVGQDTLAGINYSLSASVIQSTYSDTSFGSASLDDLFNGSSGVVWGGLYQKDSNGNIVDVMHRMSVTSVYQHKNNPSGGSLIDNVNSELQEGFVCSQITNAALGFGCAALALPGVGNLINKLVWPDYFAGPGYTIQKDYLNDGDYIYVSAGHAFVYHGALDQNAMHRTDYLVVYFFGTAGIYPFYQLTVDYVYP